MTGRLVLLATTPRVAAGLLTRAAWAALDEAAAVLTDDGVHPLLPGLEAAGVAASVVSIGLTHDVVIADLLGRADSSMVVWLLAPGDDSAVIDAAKAGSQGRDVSVEVLVGSVDLPGSHLLDLVAVMDRLRSPGGCPWDAQQTHLTLVEYLVEEAYETVEAIEAGDDTELREELGDLLLQVVFHARIAEERDEPWAIDDVADGITAKLVRRHPHVFADGTAHTAEQVEASWASLKALEKGRESVTDGIPGALPALVLAAKLLRRSSAVSVDVATPMADRAAMEAVSSVDGDYGELLLALVSRAGADGVDAEQSLRAAVRRYRARVRGAEGLGSATEPGTGSVQP